MAGQGNGRALSLVQEGRGGEGEEEGEEKEGGGGEEGGGRREG